MPVFKAIHLFPHLVNLMNMMNLVKLVNLVILMQLSVNSCSAVVYIPGLPEKHLVQLGDINIAAIIPIHKYSYVEPCGGQIRQIGALQHVRAVLQAVDMVNEDPDILPGRSLGYVILDDCGSDTTALAHVIVSLSPRPPDISEPFYEVSGIVGPFHSAGGILLGRFGQLIKMPLVSPTATNDALSDIAKYEYFFRVVPPDKYQAKAMIELVTHFNWSYISTVNSEGVYGENGIQQVHSYAEESGVCIAVSKEIKHHSSEAVYNEVVDSLLRHDNARVVVLFVNEEEGKGFLRAMQRAKDRIVGNRFVFIFSDTFNQLHHMEGLEEIAHGAFAIDLFTRQQPQFIKEQFIHGELYDGSNNHFNEEYWNTYHNCTWLAKENNCSTKSQVTFALDSYVPLVMDSVLTLAHSINDLLEQEGGKCDNNNDLECAQQDNLLSSIRNVSFNGTSEYIKFNRDGDILARYRYKHLRRLDGNRYQLDYVGRWDMDGDKVQLKEDMLQWPEGTVTSVCSEPCQPGEYIVYSEVICCWECHPCHDNDITTNNQSTCVACPEFYWPDSSTRSTCEQIEPSYIKLQQYTVLPIFILGLLGAIIALIFDALFIHFRDKKLIKATSRELSHVMLFAMLFSYVTVILMLMYPSEAICGVQFYGFNLAFTFAYAPLLTKVDRIGRLFKRSGVTGTQRPKFTSSRASLTIAAGLILVQVSML